VGGVFSLVGAYFFARTPAKQSKAKHLNEMRIPIFYGNLGRARLERILLFNEHNPLDVLLFLLVYSMLLFFFVHSCGVGRVW
jgi:hypothetical protein